MVTLFSVSGESPDSSPRLHQLPFPPTGGHPSPAPSPAQSVVVRLPCVVVEFSFFAGRGLCHPLGGCVHTGNLRSSAPVPGWGQEAASMSSLTAPGRRGPGLAPHCRRVGAPRPRPTEASPAVGAPAPSLVPDHKLCSLYSRDHGTLHQKEKDTPNNERSHAFSTEESVLKVPVLRRHITAQTRS